MQPDFLAFFQERMATAYEEQTWAVALIGGMNAFIASHADHLLRGIKRWPLQAAIAVTSLFALAFVWSRHFIFMHYDSAVKAALSSNPAGSLFAPDKVSPCLSFLSRWSGVTLYSLIIIGLYAVAARMIATSKPDSSL